MFCRFLLAAVAALSLSSASSGAVAEGRDVASVPSEALLGEISAWLTANFDLPSTAIAPAIRFVTAEQLAAMRGSGPESSAKTREQPHLVVETMHGRSTVALYDDANETIFLPIGWTGTSPADQSVLVHEMVHHLQRKAQLRFECPMAREKLAYTAQDRWLARFGSNLEKEFEIDRFTLFVSTACFY